MSDKNKLSYKEKFIDLLESLKKNDVVKQFVLNTLIEKVGRTRAVKKILEVMTEKFSKTTSEKTSDMMKKISGDGFRSEEKIDVKIDKFEEMVIEIENIKLAENLRYAMSLQFLERLEKCGKINTIERMKLKDVIEDVNG